MNGPVAPDPCRDHPQRPSRARCGVCARPLCNECDRFRLNGAAACARCAYEASTRPARRVSLAVAFVSLALGGELFAARRYDLWPDAAVTMVLGAVAVAVVAWFIAASGRGDGPTVEHRDPDDEAEAPPAAGASVYRASARRVMLAAAPRVSGSATLLVMLACFTGAAVLLPASLRMPRWIEVELVLALWWVTVAATLTVLLYRGFRLRDDFVYFAPWNRPDAPPPADGAPVKSSGSSSWADGCSPVDGCSGVDGEGCAGAVVVIVGIALAFGAAWVLVELAMPLMFLVMYAVFMRGIGRVANDRHGCEGSLARAARWGALWASAYLLPVAAVTWLLHLAHHAVTR